MTIKDLAKAVVNEFEKDMREEGFSSFETMKRCYGWDGQDIKEEIYYIAVDIINKTRADITIYDDCSLSDKASDYSYRQFRSLIAKMQKEYYEEEE